MNRHGNAIAGRLSLRPPQRRSLEILDRVTEIVPLELEGILVQPDIQAIAAKTTEMVIQQIIDIPRIVVLPKSEVRSGFKSFQLDLRALSYPAPSKDGRNSGPGSPQMVQTG